MTHVPVLTSSDQPQQQRWLHRFAVVTACATLLLILAGGLVTTYRVGMADWVWPTPPWYLAWLAWVGHASDRGLGFLIEHGHRLLAWIVGILTMILTGWIWIGDRRTWMKWLGVVALVAVALQGLLGGLRVIMDSRAVAVVHACVAQAFFVYLVCLAAFTSRVWLSPAQRIERVDAGRLQRLALITSCLIFLQLVFGATLRHLGPTWALVAHLVTAFLVMIHVALVAKRVLLTYADQPSLTKPVELLGGLVVVQLMLGSAAWATSPGFGDTALTVPTPAQVVCATAHVFVGALILATSVMLTLNALRLLAPLAGTSPRQKRKVPRGSQTESSLARPSVSRLEPRELWMVEGTV